MWYDILVVCILLFFLVRGASRGLIWQLAGIAGILLCVTFAGTASKVIGPHIKLDPPANQWAVMFITYLLASFVAFGFARTLNGWIEKMEMKEYNRHLGAMFGLLKGALLVLIMTFMIVTFSAKTRDMLKDSKAAHIAARTIHQLEPIIPDKLNMAAGKYIQMFDASGFVAHDPNSEEEVLPAESDSEGAPVDEDISLGQAEPFHPRDLLPGSQAAPTRTPTSEMDEEVSPDLASELVKTFGPQVSKLIEDEFHAATPRMKARLEQSITDALLTADTPQKRQLQQRLYDEGQSEGLVQVLKSWADETLSSTDSVSQARSTTSAPKRSTPSRPVAPPTRSAPEASAPRDYLDAIVATQSDFPSLRNKIKAGHTAVLKMLPAEVSDAVVQDWYGDVTNSKTDVDQGTNSSTPLQARIIRQLSVARYPESKLPLALQNQLKQFRLTAEATGVLR